MSHLLRTNKRVHAEAIVILYGDNIISFPKFPASTHLFFQIIGVGNQSRLTRVAMNGFYVARYFIEDEILPTQPISMVVAHCPNLKELVFQSHYHVVRDRKRTFRELHAHLANTPSLERVVIQMPLWFYRINNSSPDHSIKLDITRLNVAGLTRGRDQLGWVLEIMHTLPE